MWRRSSKPRRLLPAVAKAAWRRPSPTPFRWATPRCPPTPLSSPIPSPPTPSRTQSIPMGTATRTTCVLRPEARKHQCAASLEAFFSPSFISARMERWSQACRGRAILPLACVCLMPLESGAGGRESPKLGAGCLVWTFQVLNIRSAGKKKTLQGICTPAPPLL